MEVTTNVFLGGNIKKGKRKTGEEKLKDIFLNMRGKWKVIGQSTVYMQNGRKESKKKA
jgi:hypothetical protein